MPTLKTLTDLLNSNKVVCFFSLGGSSYRLNEHAFTVERKQHNFSSATVGFKMVIQFAGQSYDTATEDESGNMARDFQEAWNRIHAITWPESSTPLCPELADQAMLWGTQGKIEIVPENPAHETVIVHGPKGQELSISVFRYTVNQSIPCYGFTLRGVVDGRARVHQYDTQRAGDQMEAARQLAQAYGYRR